MHRPGVFGDLGGGDRESWYRPVVWNTSSVGIVEVWILAVGVMKYDPEKHRRRSIRLKGHDYAQAGAYFITICTHQRQCLFGQVVEGQMQLNAIGLAVQARWQTLPQNFPNLILDTWVIMPNHIHGILRLNPNLCRGDAFGSESMRSPQISHPNASPSGSGTSIAPRSPQIPQPNASPSDAMRSPQIPQPNASPVEASSIPPRGSQSHSIAATIQNFKSISTRKINQLQNTAGQIIWQRNYHEHIIRDDNVRQLIQTYICNNPTNWNLDQLHPDHPVHR